MFKPALLLTSALVALVSSPVLATEPGTGTKPAAQSTPSATTPAARPGTRYCIVNTPTGSHIKQRTCKTREDWMRDNDFDPLAK